MKKLEDVLSYLNRIPCINAGGCGISALAIYRWLKVNDNKGKLSFAYMYRDNSDSSLINNKNALKTGDTLETPAHVMVKINKPFCFKKLIDSEGMTNSRYIYGHSVDEKRMLETINWSSWNDSFDRKHVRQIQKALKINLSDVKI